jgi:hypothetical protein
MRTGTVRKAGSQGRCIFRVLLAPVVIAGVFIIGIPAGAFASARAGWTAVHTPSPGSAHNQINGVAVLSSRNAWAVGSYNNRASTAGHILIEHWNGTAWAQVPSPNPPGSKSAGLDGVTAVSATEIWAVGACSRGGMAQTLIEHWNGTAWAQVPSPNPGGPAQLNALSSVAATSPTNAWAVGLYYNGTTALSRTLIEHWNGTAWAQVPSPNPGGPAEASLNSVAVTSASSAWAVGQYSPTTFATPQTLIEHWNGTAWVHVPSPNPGSGSDLNGVAATSSSDAWAVGFYNKGTTAPPRALIEHWNGTAWAQVPSPNPGASGNQINGVAVLSARNAWAVGDYFNGTTALTLIEHWNGTAWTREPSPNPGASQFYTLQGVATTSPANIWAVGFSSTTTGTAPKTLALHCC